MKFLAGFAQAQRGHPRCKRAESRFIVFGLTKISPPDIIKALSLSGKRQD
jgi:hypothetical protein